MRRPRRSLEDIYLALDKIADRIPDDRSVHGWLISTDDGRVHIGVRSYLQELRLDLSEHIPARTATGQFARRETPITPRPTKKRSFP